MSRIVRRKIQQLVDFTLLRLSKSTEVDGVWIGVFSDGDQHEVLSRVQGALALIKRHDANRYERVIASFDRIWISYLFGAVGRYLPEQKRCQLDPLFVLSSPIEFIASTIVHEATHARLFNVGIPYSFENRHRVEKVCIRQEMLFARRIPEAEELRKRISEKLLLDPEVWSKETSAERLRNAFVKSDGGLPKGLRRRLYKSV
ncbi:hypothetical protein [Rhizobium tubonense]|uniref:Uncharacterized protein n=1 Tax=Rhizobium tubonense TaxID=484088 RepID=A0A2W4CVV0_9HYPH|nr:hypothetical protein [Rhizobium tubonense]PZM15591.1 hypothetical protein CPY51_07155 [Rhizobium tubonense]